MRTFLLNPSLHGTLSYAIFLALTISSGMSAGFWGALFLSAISCWFRPCYLQFVFGAILGLMLSVLVSFLWIEGSAALLMLPLMAMVLASAFVCGCLSARLLRWITGRLL